MIVVDSGVWIDYFNGRRTDESDRLDQILGVEPVIVGDLILVEVLQGFQRDADVRAAQTALAAFPTVSMVGPEQAVKAATLYRTLRGRGVTVRKTLDVLIGAYCLAAGHALLFTDRDFRPMVEHLGLRAA